MEELNDLVKELKACWKEKEENSVSTNYIASELENRMLDIIDFEVFVKKQRIVNDVVINSYKEKANYIKIAIKEV